MPITTESDGSSTWMTGSGRGSSRSASVSPIVTSARPGERDDLARAGLLRLDAVERLRHVQLADLRALDRPVGAAPGDRLAAADDAVADAADGQAPDVERGVEVGDVAPAAGGPGSCRGAGTCSSSRSMSGPRSCGERVRLEPGAPGLARCSRRSGTRSGPRPRRGRGTGRRPRRRTSAMRASGRSTLLITRITGSRASSALRSTKRVCGSGPSEASTSSSTPSTIVSPRSTSPPKSAWPGVSTMLSLTPR